MPAFSRASRPGAGKSKKKEEAEGQARAASGGNATGQAVEGGAQDHVIHSLTSPAGAGNG
jgi:hypothetical protein